MLNRELPLSQGFTPLPLFSLHTFEPRWSQLVLARTKTAQEALPTCALGTTPPEGPPLDSNSCGSFGTVNIIIEDQTCQLFVVPHSGLRCTFSASEGETNIFYSCLNRTICMFQVEHTACTSIKKLHAINATQTPNFKSDLFLLSSIWLFFNLFIFYVQHWSIKFCGNHFKPQSIPLAPLYIAHASA